MNQHSSSKKKYYSPLIGAALAAASLFHFSLPVFAIGTDAGLELKNTATATYENEGGEAFEVISNEVTVTVGKIAGITNVPDGFIDSTPSDSILPGDTVSFDFEITNTGNDTSNIFIPSAATLDGHAINLEIDANDTTSVQYSTDDGANFTDRPANGIVPDIAENTSIIVRVTGTVSTSASQGDAISVRLGDTGNNTADTNSVDYPGTQNQPDDGGADDPQDQDVRTLTSSNADVSGDPVNGQREASATNSATVGSNPLALTRIEKTNAGVVDSGTAQDLSDDVITYNLELDVLDNNDPQLSNYSNFPYNPAALEGRDYSSGSDGVDTPAIFTLTGSLANQADHTNLVLISDAIPANTKLSETIAPVGNWIPVYSSSVASIPADEATWTSTAPANQTDLDTVTRVGWVYDARATANGGKGSIAAGTTVTSAAGGFTFKVVTSDLTNTATSIYNISQIFGSTDDGDTATTGGQITFDESGDQNPNNLNDDGTGGPDETIEDGIADPGNNEDNVDLNNDNSATGSDGGEVNKVRVTPGAVASDLLNGPGTVADDIADAVGEIFGAEPADDNHDFQNLGASTPTTNTTNGTTGNVNTTYDPDPVTFSNTVENPTTVQITDVILLPLSPEGIPAVTTGGVEDAAYVLGGAVGDLPDGTTVKITYGNQEATYTYDGAGNFTLGASQNLVGDLAGEDRVTIPSINGNSSVEYTVTVDLPAGTSLSTNHLDPSDPSTAQENIGGYPVPIIAYIDDDNNDADDGHGTPGLTTADIFNITVDQVYTGYLKLVKKARVLRANETTGQFAEVSGMGFDDPDGDKFPAPGDIIEYQVTYSNISEPQGNGTDNVLLRADDIQITEDGTAGENNWALDGADDNDSIMDTLNVPSSALDSNSGTITFFKGNPTTSPTNTTDKEVTRYLDTINTLAPGADGTFTFQRKVTDADDIEELTP